MIEDILFHRLFSRTFVTFREQPLFILDLIANSLKVFRYTRLSSTLNNKDLLRAASHKK